MQMGVQLNISMKRLLFILKLLVTRMQYLRVCCLKGIRVVLAPTGVKHITKKAEEFDVGVAYEANGHGNVSTKKCYRFHMG